MLSPLLDAGWILRLYRHGPVYVFRAQDGARSVVGKGDTVAAAWLNFVTQAARTEAIIGHGEA